MSLKRIIRFLDKLLFAGILDRLKNNYAFKKTVRQHKKSLEFLFNYYPYLNKIYHTKKNNLSYLCEFYGSDKGYLDFEKKTPYGWKAHTYTDFYSTLFDHCRDSIKLVFECGIGTNDPTLPSTMTSNGRPGASLRVWKNYFFNANIYGADIDKKILFNEDRIKTFFVNQLDKDSIEIMWKNINQNNFDLIIDDGLHTYESGVNLFLHSFQKLKKNGIYIIEDVHSSYLKKMTDKLEKYKPSIVILESKLKFYTDNNIIVFRKD